MVTPAEVVELVFTTANPETGGPPPPEIAWAVFEHGTAYFTVPGPELGRDASTGAIADAARAALQELGPVRAGTSAADFNVVRLSGWYPDVPVWFVTYHSPSLATVLVDDFTSDLAAGMTGRIHRDRDHDSMRIVAVRNFADQRAPDPDDAPSR